MLSPSSSDESGAAADSTSPTFEAVYDRLKVLAHRQLSGGARGTLDTTALVHELYLRMEGGKGLAFERSAQFFAYAARAMRTLAIDRARERSALKRGGGLDITSLDTQTAEDCAEPETLSQIGEALDELATLDAELAIVVDLKFFCGFTIAEIADLQGISERTVQRHWEKARLLLFRMLDS